MQFSQIYYFLEIVRCQSISKASEKLYISKASLSESIARMEKELGFKLFKRSNRGVELTDAGRIFYDGAWQIDKIAKSWEQMRTDSENLLEEHIGIMTSNTLASSIFKNILLNLAKMHPELVITANQGSGADFISEYQANAASISAIIVSDASQQELRTFCVKNNLQIEVLAEDYYGAIANKDHWLAEKNSMTLNELQDCSLVIQSKKSKTSPLIRYLQEELKEITFATSNQAIILEMVESEQVVSIFPSLVVKNFSVKQKEQLCFIPIVDFKLHAAHWMIHPKKEWMTPGERKVVDYIKQYYKEKM